MAYNGLRIARDVLFRGFLIGLLVLILASVVWLAGINVWTSLLVDQWHWFPDRTTLQMVMLIWIGFLKFCIFFYLMLPWLALHWTLKHLEKKAG